MVSVTSTASTTRTYSHSTESKGAGKPCSSNIPDANPHAGGDVGSDSDDPDSSDTTIVDFPAALKEIVYGEPPEDNDEPAEEEESDWSEHPLGSDSDSEAIP